MTTQKPTFIRLQLSLIEELLNEIVEDAIEEGYGKMAYLSGKLEGAIEGAISPIPQNYHEREAGKDRELLNAIFRQQKEELQSIQEKINE